MQEAARSVRYQHFQNVCNQHQMGVLLVAHHADDQAELFILRLSRNSGVLGLAGMAFTSQLFDTYPNFEGGASNSILLVRPLLEFSKEDMYKICQGGNQEWVEDPTNQSQLFARNRIRMSLKNLPSSTFKPELEAAIFACRRTRVYVDQICRSLINQAVNIMPQGYAVIDLEILNPSKIMDICLSKFIALLLQFISQRHRPVRGSALKLLLDYIRTYPCKTSLTAAGCYLCAAPGSKGAKVLVCCSVNCSLPLETELFYRHSYEGQKCYVLSEVEQIVADGKFYSDQMALDASDVHFLDATSSESVLSEAKRLNMISECTHRTILSLQNDEIERFKSKTGKVPDFELKNEVESVTTSLGNALHPDQIGYFMDRFLLTWKLSKKLPTNTHSVVKADLNQDLREEVQQYYCISCLLSHDMVPEVRHMIDADWLYLAELSKCRDVEDFQDQRLILDMKMGKETARADACSEYKRLSAQRALLSLKSIPVAARRGLPVLVNSQGILLSIPSVGFKHCPYLEVSAILKPSIPLGGGHSSYV